MFRKHYLFQAWGPKINVQTPLAISELYFSSILLVAKMKISECLGGGDQKISFFSNVRFSIKSSSDQEIRSQGEESMWQNRRITKMVPPHKYIRDTSTDQTILTDHLLNTSGRLWRAERVRKIPLQPLGWRKDKREIKKRNQQFWWKAEGEEGFLPSEKKKNKKQPTKKPYNGDVCWHSKRLSGDQRGTQWTAYAR